MKKTEAHLSSTWLKRSKNQKNYLKMQLVEKFADWELVKYLNTTII